MRARQAIHGEFAQLYTRIDWTAGIQFVKEPIEEVGTKIAEELPSFVSFTAPNGAKIWINAAKVIGPFAQNSVCSLYIMGYKQYVQEDPGIVRHMIESAGGTVL